MESEIRAGQPIQHRKQVLGVDVDNIDPGLRGRVEAIADGVMPLKLRHREVMCVLDSGIDPELSFGPTDKQLVPLDKPILNIVGALPELESPSDDVEAVVQAWEKWLALYNEEALKAIDRLNADPPAAGEEEDNFLEEEIRWGPVVISLGEGLYRQIDLEHGARAIRDARAAHLWNWAASRRYSSESYQAAKEATGAARSQSTSWLANESAEALAALYLEQARRCYQAAKAHDAARRAKVPDFDVEMKRWAAKHGSDRLRLGIEDGYRMNARYLSERIAVEAPGFYAMSANSAKQAWAVKATSPSEAALRLRRRVAAAIARTAPPNLDGRPEAEIVIVKDPPHEIYEPDAGVPTEDGLVGVGLPSRAGWPWSLDAYGEPVNRDPKPFEAVVVKHWLGRFHLVGAVASDSGRPPGIWAIPDPDLYADDGAVIAQDPDGPAPATAKRKPPEPPVKDDDIPF